MTTEVLSLPSAKKPRLFLGTGSERDEEDEKLAMPSLSFGTVHGCGLPVLQFNCSALGELWRSSTCASALRGPLRRQLLCSPGDGVGAVLIRGVLWPQDIEEMRASFLEWADVLGLRAVPQSTDLQELVADVTSRPAGFGDRIYRGYRNPHAQKLHCDANRPSIFGTAKCDVLAMLCVRSSDEGGASKLLQAETLHRVIEEERPDLYDRLCSAFPWNGERDWMDEWGPRKDVAHGLPLLSRGRLADKGVESEAADAWPAVQYGKILRQNVEAGFAARAAEGSGPPMSELDKEAMDFLEQVANREDLFFRLKLKPGEVLFLNNYAWMHGRDAFPEEEADGGKRHMMRMWLKL